MPQPLTRLRETPSQTAGPYVQIGLLPNVAGIAGVYASGSRSPDGQRKDEGRAHHYRRPRLRRNRRADPRLPPRDLAGGRGGTLSRPIGNARRGRPQLHRLGTSTCRCDFRPLSLRDYQAGPRSLSRWTTAGAACQLVDRGARYQSRAQYTALFWSTKPSANAADPVARRIEHPKPRCDADRRRTRLRASYLFDIRLQGETETVFFDI